MTMPHLTAREWLEHERATGLRHADFAGDVLRDLDTLASMEEADTSAAGDLEEVTNALLDLPGNTIVEKAEWAGEQLEKLIETVGAADVQGVVAEAQWLNDQFWEIWGCLEDADLVGRNSKAHDTDICGLLRMFLPVND